jgi:AraC-like DNA-binding protein
MARPRKDLTEEQIAQVRKLAAVLTMEQIADFLGISVQTLRRRFQNDQRVLEAYKKGKGEALAGVATNLIQQAREGNTTAAIFYLKTQGGWREQKDVEISGPNKGPIQVEQLDPAEMRRRALLMAEELLSDDDD